MKKFIRVDDWVPEESDQFVKPDGALLNVDFGKLFNREVPESMNSFIIKKKSYITAIMDVVKRDYMTGAEIIQRGMAHYINYFLKFYDTDKELALAYLKLKVMIDRRDVKIKNKLMVDSIYKIIFTPTMVDKIGRFSDDNWYLDLTPKRGTKYIEQLEFTNDHARKIMSVSTGMKLIIPVMMHYFNTRNIPDDERKEKTGKFFMPLFDIFSGDTDLYNKLWITVYSRVQKSLYNDSPNWAQQEILGREPESKTDELLEGQIVREAMCKYVFSRNFIHFNSVILRHQLVYFVSDDFGHTLVVVDNEKTPEGLSGLDKLEMNGYKIDESIPTISKLNNQHIIKKMKHKMGIGSLDDEVEFYKRFHDIERLHSVLVHYYYAEIFGGYRDLLMLNRHQYLELVIMLKRKLRDHGFTYLPQLLTANVVSLSNRTIRNRKFLEKIGGSSVYRDLVESRFQALEELGKDDLILSLLSSLIGSKFSIVDYDNPDDLGMELVIENQDILSDEFLNFLAMI